MESSLSSSQFLALLAGERGAQALFVRIYLPRVSRWVGRGMRGREVDAGDVIQDTFVEALCHVHGVRELERLSAWMRQVAHNVVCRYFRHLRNYQRIELKDPVELEGGFTVSSSATVVDLRTALSVLRQREAAIFFYRHVEGFNIEELSTHFRVSPSTVKRCLTSGRVRVTRRLGGAPGRRSIVRACV